MKITLIGSGNRATAYAKYYGKYIVSVCDTNLDKAYLLKAKYNLENIKIYQDYKEAMKEDSNVIIIATPDHTHLEVFKEAIKTKKAILLEKPVEVNINALKKLYELGKNYSNSIVLAFGLRYTFMYKKILEIKNEIGQLISIEANEELDKIHTAKFFRRWHRFSENSGGMLNTKCSHDMNILNSVAGGKPISVASFGSNIHFKNQIGQLVCDSNCEIYNTCKFVDKEQYLFSSVDTTLCPYTSKSNIVDHQVAIIEYENKVTTTFTLSMHSNKGNREIKLYGTEGVIRASMEDQIVKLYKTHPKQEIIFEPEEIKGGHGGGDYGLCKYFEEVVNNNIKINELEMGVLGSIVALASEVSRKEKRVIDLKEYAKFIF